MSRGGLEVSPLGKCYSSCEEFIMFLVICFLTYLSILIVLRERPGSKPVFLIRGKESATVPIFLPPEVSVESSFTGKERAVEYEVERMRCEKMKK